MEKKKKLNTWHITIGRIQEVRLEIFIQHSIFLKIGGH